MYDSRIGLRIIPEFQSDTDFFRMIQRGDRFIVHITRDGNLIDFVTEMGVEEVQKVVVGRDKWRVVFYGQRQVGLMSGVFTLEFDGLLCCDELPPEMFV